MHRYSRNRPYARRNNNMENSNHTRPSAGPLINADSTRFGSFLFRENSNEHVTRPLIQPNVVQCLLCGRLENDKRVYKQHFIRNHCTYGYHRQCKQCGQHFSDKIDLAHHNEDKNACPGQPLVYSRKTGDLYYRGSNASVMLSFPVYPRLCDNHFIGKCKQESTEECAVIETGGNSAEAEENTVETTEYQVSNVEGGSTDRYVLDNALDNALDAGRLAVAQFIDLSDLSD